MKKLKVANIDIEFAEGPVAISASGGADSSLLLHLLVEHCSGPIHVLTGASREKFRTSATIAQNIVQWQLDRTGRTDLFHHVFYYDVQTFQNLFKNVDQLATAHGAGCIYTAVTANPPDDQLENSRYFHSPVAPLHDRRRPDVIRPVRNGLYYSPFFNHNKRDIGAAYHELGLLDTLYPLTRSCESTTQATGHCGVCWWCEERRWGFEPYVES